jgi:hypothetical protein
LPGELVDDLDPQLVIRAGEQPVVQPPPEKRAQDATAL